MTSQRARHIGQSLYRIWKWGLWALRWLAILVFGLLFCVGVVVALPWKILVCLAIIPLVGLFVPLRIQPWCWAGLTLILIGVAVWIYVPRDDNGRWRTYRFDEDLARAVQDRRIDGQPNAALLYNKVLEQYDESIFDDIRRDWDAEWETFSNPWHPADYPEMSAWMEGFEPAIPMLIEASGVDQCRFPIAYNLETLRAQQKRLNQFKGWGRFLIRSANADLLEGRLDEALQKELVVLGMARHLYQQHTLFDQAGAFFLELIASRALKRHVLEFTDKPESLDRMRRAAENVKPDWPGAWKGVMAQETLIAKSLAALLYQVDENGSTRINRRLIAAAAEDFGYPVPAVLRHPAVSRGVAIALWLSIPISPVNAGRLVDRRFEKFAELARTGTPAAVLPIQDIWRLGLNPTSAVDWLARHQTSFYAALDGQYQRHIAMGRMTSLIVELERYRLAHASWPEDLSVLQAQLKAETFMDPVSGTLFVYGLADNCFYLYSTGPNGIDDGGRNDARRGWDDVVFWPEGPENLE